MLINEIEFMEERFGVVKSSIEAGREHNGRSAYVGQVRAVLTCDLFWNFYLFHKYLHYSLRILDDRHYNLLCNLMIFNFMQPSDKIK